MDRSDLWVDVQWENGGIDTASKESKDRQPESRDI
jgi:hypothetical protein